MRLFVAVLFAIVSVSYAQQKQQIDPAYLREYYARLAAQGGNPLGAPRSNAAPIYEQQQEPAAQQQYSQQAPQRNVILFTSFV
jgi:hypothetical protein